jgi:exonuclease III
VVEEAAQNVSCDVLMEQDIRLAKEKADKITARKRGYDMSKRSGRRRSAKNGDAEWKSSRDKKSMDTARKGSRLDNHLMEIREPTRREAMWLATKEVQYMSMYTSSNSTSFILMSN